ncbi:MAG: hypothetical protein QS721_11800 [Candidatus Endonucleobacter sp. (ex Gigantidas childressi)]|nr:hypothetical protein [Candidatus Endonucleobacter sp. (ex Gigantidas childressi)]
MFTSSLVCSIPVAFQSATLLAALAHPDHLLLVGSWGFSYLPPSSNLKSFGYIRFFEIRRVLRIKNFPHASIAGGPVFYMI